MTDNLTNPHTLGTLKRASKRAFDLVLSAAGLLVTFPLHLAIAIAIRLTMGRPVLFRQTRPGLGGRPFTLVKFRTMSEPQDGKDATDGARLTRLGAFLRRTSLDEIPELWNVLRGDMSLVGPRPLLDRYLDRYSSQQARRHEVKPGVTGLAQVNGRNAISWEEKLDLDVWYVDHQSLILDLKILAKTAWQVFAARGISAPGHATMPEFKGSDNG
jgi:sugar transferase EpsL